MRILKFIGNAAAIVAGIGVVTALSGVVGRAFGWEMPGENVPFKTMIAAAVPIILILVGLDAMERKGDKNSVGSVLIIFLGTVLFGVLFMVFTDSCGPPRP